VTRPEPDETSPDLKRSGTYCFGTCLWCRLPLCFKGRQWSSQKLRS